MSFRFILDVFAVKSEHRRMEDIQMKIHELRGTKVILDRDLAELYGVTTGNLYKAAKFQNGISRWADHVHYLISLLQYKSV